MVGPCWFRRRSRGSAQNGRAVKVLPTALRARHKKRKFAKRTWNVSWNQQINFLVRSTDPVAEARTHRKKRDVCATRGWFWLREAHPTVGERSRNVPWNQLFHKVRAYRGLGA